MPNVAAAAVYPVVLEIGNQPICLRAEDPSFLDLILSRYSSFVTPASHAPMSLDVEVTRRTNDVEADIHVARESGLWSAERADFKLDWNPSRNSGALQLGLNAYSLDASLRILHTLLLAETGGFLLHSASAIRNDRASFFFGPSGAGKTTMARLAPPGATLLSDEISYIRRHGDNYLAYGTPFTGELAKSGENVSAPIGALYHLVQAPTNRITRLGVADAARALLGSVLFFAEDSHLVKLVFQSVCDFVQIHPVHRLEFVPDKTVWDLVQ